MADITAQLTIKYKSHLRNITKNILNSTSAPKFDEQALEELNRSSNLLFKAIVDHLELTLDKSIEQGWNLSKIIIMTMPYTLQYGEHAAGYLLMGSKRNPSPTNILDKLETVLGHRELFGKVVDDFGHIRCGINHSFYLFTIGKLLGDGFVLHFDKGNGIAADIRKAIVIGMVVATFQQYAVRELVPDLEVDTHRGDGVRQDFFVMCF